MFRIWWLVMPIKRLRFDDEAASINRYVPELKARCGCDCSADP
jgi:2',3'-cyclic-nucleotide 2'-phosphodiesterase (5'-nucleotidase family)